MLMILKRRKRKRKRKKISHLKFQYLILFILFSYIKSFRFIFYLLKIFIFQKNVLHYYFLNILYCYSVLKLKQEKQ